MHSLSWQHGCLTTSGSEIRPIDAIVAGLGRVAGQARLCLVLGLLAGLALPGVADAMRHAIPPLVALLLFLSALRIGARQALGGMADLRATASRTLVYQLAAPLLAFGIAYAFGLLSSPLVFAIILMLAAPPVTGAPNFTALMGHDPAPPMRMLILGTALFPLTVLPVLFLLPALGEPAVVLTAALTLVSVIAVAVAIGFGVRRVAFDTPAPAHVAAIDGASAITLSVVVVGLMSALGPLLRDDPLTLLMWLFAVASVNLGAQLLGWRAYREPGLAIAAGNRNIALFLVALPPEITDPILIFIGCYQIPMYLTPILMAKVYR